MCLLMSLCSYSQSANLEYYEVADNPTADSTGKSLTCVLAIRNPQSADSLSLSITDGSGATLYAASNTITGWTAAQANRTEYNVLYLTIENGTYSGLEKYVATAMLKTDGDWLSYVKP